MSLDQIKLDETLNKIEQFNLKKRNAGLIIYLILLFNILVIAMLIYFAWEYVREMANNLDDLNQQVLNLREKNDQLEQKNKILTETLDKVESTLHSNSNVKAAEILIKDADKKLANIKPVSQTNQNSQNTTNANVSFPSKSIPYRVYVQIVDENQRNQVSELTKRLNNSGFIFPGIEFIENRKIVKTEIRYFREEDKQQADKLKELLASDANKIDAIVVYTNLKASSNVLEIWFSNDAFTSQVK